MTQREFFQEGIFLGVVNECPFKHIFSMCKMRTNELFPLVQDAFTIKILHKYL